MKKTTIAFAASTLIISPLYASNSSTNPTGGGDNEDDPSVSTHALITQTITRQTPTDNTLRNVANALNENLQNPENQTDLRRFIRGLGALRNLVLHQQQQQQNEDNDDDENAAG